MVDAEVLKELHSVFDRKGPMRVIALRPVLYLDHEEVQDALVDLERRLTEHATTAKPLSHLEKVAIMLLMDAAGIVDARGKVSGQ